MRTMWFVIFLTLSCTVSTRGNSSEICDMDSHCRPGFFCMSRSSQCTECVNCSVFNRIQNHFGCLKSPEHCGECMPGYSNDQCAPLYCDYCRKNSEQDSTIIEGSSTLFGRSFIYYISGGVIILFVVVVVFATFLNKKTFSRPNTNQGERETREADVEQNLLCQPPSYSQAISTAPLQIVCEYTENAFQDEQLMEGSIVQRKDRENLQEATVYRVPSCERRRNFRRGDNSSDHGSDNSTEQLEVPVVIDQDESTLESYWTSDTSAEPHRQEIDLSVALLEASEARLIVQPGEADTTNVESAPPPKRIRIVEDVGSSSETSESVPHSVRNNVLNIDLNENILRQGSSSTNSHNARNHRSNTQDSQSSDEGEAPPRFETDTNYNKGNFYVVIQQNMKIHK